MGFSGVPYGVTASLLGIVFLQRVYRVITDRQDERGQQPDQRCAGQGRVQILGAVPVRAVRGVGDRSTGWIGSMAEQAHPPVPLRAPTPRAAAAAEAGRS